LAHPPILKAEAGIRKALSYHYIQKIRSIAFIALAFKTSTISFILRNSTFSPESTQRECSMTLGLTTLKFRQTGHLSSLDGWSPKGRPHHHYLI